MMTLIRPTLVLLGAFTAVTGLAYPALVTGASLALFPAQARGSLLSSQGRVVGSTLIGQAFEDPRYFWGRPSATTPLPYDASASSGSNLGPSNPTLLSNVRARVTALREADPDGAPLPVPVDLVTASASGLDPDLSPAAALYQVHRVARLRGLAEADVRRLVETHLEGRLLGIFGEPHVNVLRLNLALDALASKDR